MGLAPGPPPPAGRPGSRTRFGPSAPAVLLAAARRPWDIRPMAVMAGLLPEGPIPTTVISDGVAAMLGDRWPAQPRGLAGVRSDTAGPIVLGRAGAPDATPAEAVAASCAIPGWFAPVRIGGVRYIDGGAHSLTNVTRLARAGVDLVLVSAPMGRAG